MPSSFEQAPTNQHHAADNEIEHQDEAPKLRTGSGKRAKARRKDGSAGEPTNQGTMTSPPLDAIHPNPASFNTRHTPPSPNLAPTNVISSPLLAALNARPQGNAQYQEGVLTGEWANAVTFGSSPPERRFDGTSLGGSPPNYLQSRSELRGGFSHTSPPASPSATYRQLARPNNTYQSFGDYLGSSPGQPRSVLINTKDPYPPPPHQPQAHFYGTPRIDFGMAKPHTDHPSPVKPSCCLFDSLALAGEGPRATDDVLLVGLQHGLEVYTIGKTKPMRIGSLEGLRGAVLNAKILPAQSGADPLRSYRPLIAVVVYGFCDPSDTGGPTVTNHPEESLFDPSSSMLHALHAADISGTAEVPLLQTSVDVYSLKEQRYLATLYKSPRLQAGETQVYNDSRVLPPEANLSIQARGKFIVIASGFSGELFVFDSRSFGLSDTTAGFQCLGKFWTRTSPTRSRSSSVSSDSSEAGSFSTPSSAKKNGSSTAIFSLSHRWLALVPPVASTQRTMHGIVVGGHSPKEVPGLRSHTAPPEPPITCETDTPEAESLLNKVARDVAQEFMKGARWVGGQGLQAWNSYWSRPPSQDSAAFSNPYPPQSAPTTYAQQSFPPTHANDTPSTRKSSQPVSIAVLDLEKLTEEQHLKPDKAMQPVAIFPLTYGCSFVSFAPSGLHLLTTSTKGDVQQVWSLLRMANREALTSDTENKAPVVREIKRFTRMTEAIVVDIIWESPKGERLAVVTDRGTVHVYDIPSAALQWPPPRRLLRHANAATAPTIPSGSDEYSSSAGTQQEHAGSKLGTAFNIVAGRTQPFFSAVRRRPASVGSAFSGWSGLNIPAATGAKSSRAMTAGFNKSVGAATGTVNSLRHLGENRFSLPTSHDSIMRGRAQWLGDRVQGRIAVVGGQTIRIHSVARSTNSKARTRRSSVTAQKPVEYALPTLKAPVRRPHSSHDPAYRNAEHEISPQPSGFWQSPVASHQQGGAIRDPHPLSYAEIETNAPYQPFHTDRRVGFYVYDDDDAVTMAPQQASAPWVFGEPIATTKIRVNSAALDEDTAASPDPAAPLENLISVEETDQEAQQFVVTTRRKRTNNSQIGDEMMEDADFFEDDYAVVDFADDRV
ncbi:MAG: hypothetical protein Q9191_001412 [Dirinaria sp. TL-2023a]